MAVSCEQADLLTSLRERFGHSAFRPGQEAVVSAVVGGLDVLAVMPTGSGKSLGYQLPAVVLPGTTIVVSPLISLMKDQVDELNRRGIPSGAVHSMMSADAREDVLARAKAGRLRLLYVAPERFASPGFVRFLTGLQLARFVVDEAHCVSEWGHDFRPDYRRLREAAAACRGSDGVNRPPMAAFTATATPDVREDIVRLLGLTTPRVIVSGFDRPNIFLRVRRMVLDEEKHRRLPSFVRGRRALVYAATRRSTEAAAATLAAAGIESAAYHAGLKDDERTRVQDAFASGRLRVVCATNAFGMGIDRPDVDAVVHFAIPGSLEAYYQEIGRAGRDGRAATATLLWNDDDVGTRQFLIDSPRRDKQGRPQVAVDPAELARRKAVEHRRLDQMVSFAVGSGCLRAQILRYFGDPAARGACSSCGNCRPHLLDAPEAEIVRTILAGIANSGERYGRRRLVAMLTGEVVDLPPGLASTPQAGALGAEDPGEVGQWMDALVGSRLLQVSPDEYRTLSLTDQGRDIARGKIASIEIVQPTPGYYGHMRFDAGRRGYRRRWSGGGGLPAGDD
jgi:ATP-dependent DNA helicase RecQ